MAVPQINLAKLADSTPADQLIEASRALAYRGSRNGTTVTYKGTSQADVPTEIFIDGIEGYRLPLASDSAIFMTARGAVVDTGVYRNGGVFEAGATSVAGVVTAHAPLWLQRANGVSMMVMAWTAVSPNISLIVTGTTGATTCLWRVQVEITEVVLPV